VTFLYLGFFLENLLSILILSLSSAFLVLSISFIDYLYPMLNSLSLLSFSLCNLFASILSNLSYLAYSLYALFPAIISNLSYFAYSLRALFPAIISNLSYLAYSLCVLFFAILSDLSCFLKAEAASLSLYASDLLSLSALYSSVNLLSNPLTFGGICPLYVPNLISPSAGSKPLRFPTNSLAFSTSA
jgi:hypothetical protein